jgi:hypothetical protein
VGDKSAEIEGDKSSNAASDDTSLRAYARAESKFLQMIARRTSGRLLQWWTRNTDSLACRK